MADKEKQEKIQYLKNIASILRKDSLVSTSEAGSGHPTSCLSSADILSVLFFDQMHYDVNNPKNPNNDEFILSKGHAAPILYSCLKNSGCIKDNLLALRKINSNLEGHPIPHNPWIKIASGSLGQGLSVGIGMALAAKLQDLSYKTYVLLGDSELAEGSIYEALQLAAFYKLNNLIAIIDINKLGQSRETMLSHNVNEYKIRLEAFGWHTIVIDGHNIEEIIKSFTNISNQKPTAIIAKTIKGKGISFIEGKEGWHGKALSKELLIHALKELPDIKMPKINIKKPTHILPNTKSNQNKDSFHYQLTKNLATREAYGYALLNLAKLNPLVLALDAEVSNSTFSEKVKHAIPKQYIECFIAEQNMISIALGLSKKGITPYCSTFAAFLTRAHDQIRMANYSKGNLTITGSHCGVSIGEDGSSQMGLEDIAMFRSIPNSIILYPSDNISTKKLLDLTLKNNGIKYFRTTRSALPTIYKEGEEFNIGDFKILKQSNKDRVVLIGSGITLHESLKAHNSLINKKINSAVIDLYCIKPLNTKKLISFIEKHGNKVIITEDHYKEGGIGEAIISALTNTKIQISHLSVNEIPHSGKKEELLEKYKIDSKAIVKEAEKIIR